MRWQQLQYIVQNQPLFETSLLLAGDVTHHQAQRQLSDWANAHKVIQLRRGIYTLPNQNPHPFVVANHLVPGSYVSLQMALAYYHLIPEHVAVITSVTTQRPGTYENKFGGIFARGCLFGLLYELIDEMESGDEIVFGDQIGSWMIPGDEKQYLRAYITAAAQTTTPDEFAAIVVPLAQRDSYQSLSGEVYATACHLADVAQKEKLKAEIKRLNIRTERQW